MDQPTRLFDLPYYQLARYPRKDMLAAKAQEDWKPYSTQWFTETARHLAANLCQAGVGFQEWTPEKRDKVAILSENRPEWLLLDQAVQQCGAVLVPIYPTIHENDLVYIFKEAEIKWVFVSTESMYRKVDRIRDQTPLLANICSFNNIAGVRHWTQLLQPMAASYYAQIDLIKEKTRPDDLVTIIYTSGTTGLPKGVMLTHDNLLSNVRSGYQCLPINEGGKALSFLPLNHVYERMVSYLYIYAGVAIYYAESMETIGDNLREVQPYIFTTVPRLLEKVYEKIMDKAGELKGLKRKLFNWAMVIGSRYELHKPQSRSYRIQLFLARKLVFSKWQKALGGNVQTIITGSAACQLRLLRLFTAAEIIILEGYGLTETSPVISVNRMEKADRRFGTVGPVIDGVTVKIAADGEILCKGPNVMAGYFKQPALTQEAIQDGWFKTGDIGEWVDQRFLKITDRKKELFKTSGGKYVAPLPIETKMAESPYINQIMVLGANEKFTAALIVPDFKHVIHWLEQKGIATTDPREIVKIPGVIRMIKEEVKALNKSFNHVEQVKEIRLLPEEWDIKGGELTPTLKLKRNAILKKYQNTISDIYR